MAPYASKSGLRLYALLRDVSRSFYLTLRVLPSAVRPQIGLAYLLARATDTIADTDLAPVQERLAALARLRARILGEANQPLDFRPFLESALRSDATAAECRLLEQIEPILGLLAQCEAVDLQRIRALLATITSGQELDLRRFARDPTDPAPPRLRALEGDNELDDYIYRVAGCVGEFWTHLCRAHLFPQAPLDEARLLEHAVLFGKGLQMVNILRDLPRDLRLGRCYLPAAKLAWNDLRPEDLLDPASFPRFHPLYHGYLERTQHFLMAGWAYTLALPRSQVRVRLACAWPILIGHQTLRLLRLAPILNPDCRVKISRATVWWIVARTVLLYPFPRAFQGLFYAV